MEPVLCALTMDGWQQSVDVLFFFYKYISLIDNTDEIHDGMNLELYYSWYFSVHHWQTHWTRAVVGVHYTLHLVSSSLSDWTFISLCYVKFARVGMWFMYIWNLVSFNRTVAEFQYAPHLLSYTVVQCCMPVCLSVGLFLDTWFTHILFTCK